MFDFIASDIWLLFKEAVLLSLVIDEYNSLSSFFLFFIIIECYAWRNKL